jgi:hypothetical protein
LVNEIQTTYDENHFVYGDRKIWIALNKKGISVARCTVERLMGDMGLVGARRGRAFKVTTFNRENLTLLKSKCGWFKSIAALVSVTPRGGWIDSSPARVDGEGLASQSLGEPVAHLEVNDVHKCITLNTAREIIHIN